MEGHLPLVHCLAARYLGITQSTRTTDPYSLSASLNGTENRLFHGSAVSNTALNLFRYRFSHQISIKFGLSNLLDVQADSLPDQFLKVRTQFINPLSSPPDDDARSSRMDSYSYLFCLVVSFYQRDSRVSISGLNRLPQL